MSTNDYADDKDIFLKYRDIKSILKYGIPLKGIPNISFVIPTYKKFSLLKNTIASIIIQPDIGLSYEIIVIDNDCFEFKCYLEMGIVDYSYMSVSSVVLIAKALNNTIFILLIILFLHKYIKKINDLMV